MKNSSFMAITSIIISFISLITHEFNLALIGLAFTCIAVICLTIEESAK